MVNRCIYFVRNNQLYKRTVSVDWDMDAIEVSKVLCRRAIESSLLPFMKPCIDVSSASPIYQSRNLATCYVKDSTGKPVRDIWKQLDNGTDKKYLPPGCYDLLYLTSLNESQISYALSQASFYDTFHNPDKSSASSSKALASLQLLLNQGKVDYIEDMNKFLYWYFINCDSPLEWNEKYDE